MNLISPAASSRSGSLRRVLACFLFLLVVADLGFHFAESFLGHTDHASGTAVSAAVVNSESDSGCPIPGHSSTAFHHHHFFAVVTQASQAIPLMAIARAFLANRVENVPLALLKPLSRGPPVPF